MSETSKRDAKDFSKAFSKGFKDSIQPWVLYDIPNEHILFCELGYIPTEEDSKKNIIKMPYGQAEYIRRAKNLPMPCPRVEVVVRDSLLDKPVKLESPKLDKTCKTKYT